jgi:acetoin utilization deacetylase AcuC-like enzyme
VNKTAIVFSPIYYRHNPGKDHPESAERLRAIINELEKSGLAKNKKLHFVHPDRASIEDIALAHAVEYIRLVEAACKFGGGLLDLQDTVVSSESFEVALYAAGGALKAVDLVMNGKCDNAFALVRPPGHHAGKYRALGFCLFNNVAIAAEHLLRSFKLKRVLILDVDAHHGNGTQEKFYDRNDVLYVSLHEDPSSFPGTGFIDEIGEGKGLGYNVNIPLPFGTTDHVYLKAMKEIVEPIACQYKPEITLVSAGFDGHYTDPVGELSLSASCIQQTYEIIANLSSELCQGKLVSVLEGGYRLKIVGKLAAAAIAKMSAIPYATKDRAPTAKRRAESQGLKILGEVKKVQGAFWRLE